MAMIGHATDRGFSIVVVVVVVFIFRVSIITILFEWWVLRMVGSVGSKIRFLFYRCLHFCVPTLSNFCESIRCALYCMGILCTWVNAFKRRAPWENNFASMLCLS